MPEETADTRNRLLRAAIEEFAREGFDNATVRDICGRAEANVNAVNYHFGDKQQLYVEAVKAAHRSISRGIGPEQIDQIAEQFDGDPQQRLRAFVGQMAAMAMALENRTDANHRLMFREIGQPTVATEHIVREFIEPKFSQLMRILESLLPGSGRQFERRLLALSVVGQCLHYKFAAPIIPLLLTKPEQKRLTVDRVADHITTVTLAAIEQYEHAKA